MSKDPGQLAKWPKQFKLTRLGSLNQVVPALGNIRQSAQWPTVLSIAKSAPGFATAWAS
jgi:hypothetical protein